MYKTITICLAYIALAGIAFSQGPSAHFQEHAHRRPSVSAPQKVASHEDYPTLRTDYEWDTNLAQWDSAGRVTWAYYPNGNESEYIYEIFDNNSFVPNYRGTSVYNSQNLETLYTSFEWGGSAWVPGWKDESTYDQYDNLTILMEYAWNVLQWDSSYAERYSYNYVFTDKVSRSVGEYWDSNNPVWTYDYREEFTWPNAMAWDTSTSSEWNGASWDYTGRNVDMVWRDFSKDQPYYGRNQGYNGAVWEDEGRFNITYGINDSYVGIREDWSGTSWDLAYKTVMDFDAHDHYTSYEYFRWVGSWEQMYGSLSANTYDGLGHLQEELIQSYNSGAYANSERKVYSSFFTSAPEAHHLLAQVSAFPNPASDHLSFRLELQQNGPVQVALYDMQGRLRMQSISPKLIDRQLTMPISETLENGTYLYRIATKEGEATGKVVVQR